MLNPITTPAQRLCHLEEDNRSLKESLYSLTEELNLHRSSTSSTVCFDLYYAYNQCDAHIISVQDESTLLHRQPSFKWAQFKSQASPTKLDHPVESPHPSPQQLEHDIPPLSRNGGLSQLSTVTNFASTSSLDEPRPPLVSISEANGDQTQPKPSRKESSENLNKSFKVTLDDPTWKVLPAALKKYRINNDSWQNYAMFICYGSPGRYRTSWRNARKLKLFSR